MMRSRTFLQSSGGAPFNTSLLPHCWALIATLLTRELTGFISVDLTDHELLERRDYDLIHSWPMKGPRESSMARQMKVIKKIPAPCPDKPIQISKFNFSKIFWLPLIFLSPKPYYTL
jgi:hypothetical protein